MKKVILKSSSSKATLIDLKLRCGGNIIVNAKKNRKTTTIRKNIENGIQDLNLLILMNENFIKLSHLTIEHKYEWYGRKMYF